MFNGNKLWERAENGEFDFRIDPKRKELPFEDSRGNKCHWRELLFITDPKYPIGDNRHEVVREAHRHRTDDGTIGASGKWDPGKAYIQIDGKIYGKYRTKQGRKPYCQLCENGDRIPDAERHLDSDYPKSGNIEP
jgi:hypothetical protein